MATSFNVWFHINDPSTVVSINTLDGTDHEGVILSSDITYLDKDLYNCVFPTDQPEYREDPIMVPVTSGSPPVPVLSGGEPIYEPSGEYDRYVWVPDDAYVMMKDQEDLDVVNLQRAKSKQNNIIKQGFENSPIDGLTVTMTSSASPAEVKIDCFRSNQDDFRQAHEKAVRDGDDTVTIRDYDNNYQVIDTNDCETIYVAIQEFGIAQYDKKWTKQNLIDACTTVDEVEAITWDSIDS